MTVPLPIVRRFLLAAVIYLGLGLVAQAVAVLDGWLGFNPLAYTAIAATTQIFLLGWLTQVALALIYERWLAQKKPGPAIFNLPLANLVFILFNLGLPLVLVGQPGLAIFGGVWLGLLAAVGGGLQLLAGLMVFYELWQWLRTRT
jgi:hypothetical protein